MTADNICILYTRLVLTYNSCSEIIFVISLSELIDWQYVQNRFYILFSEPQWATHQTGHKSVEPSHNRFWTI